MASKHASGFIALQCQQLMNASAIASSMLVYLLLAADLLINCPCKNWAGTGDFGAKSAIVWSQSVLTCCGDLECCCQVQVDLSTPSAMTATLRRNLMEFFDENHKEFVPGGGTVIYLDSQDPLKMTLGVVYTFSHNGAPSSCFLPSWLLHLHMICSCTCVI